MIDCSNRSSDAMTVPPTKEGISPSRLYLPKIEPMPMSIFAYVCQKFGHITADEWRQRFDDGLVCDALGQALSVETPYQHGQTIYYYRAVAAEPVVPFLHEILYENEHLLVVDKPHFLTVAPAGRYVKQTLLTRLKEQTGNELLSPIHRLDKETAGVMLFAKTILARKAYQAQFADRQIQKTYHAITHHNLDVSFPCELHLNLQRGVPFYTMQVVDGVPNTHTKIHLMEQSDDGRFAKVQLIPTTGKLHQLRVHLNHLGMPILNDPFYPMLCHKADDDFANPLQLLAKNIAFIDPITQQSMFFESSRQLKLPSMALDDPNLDGI